MFLAYSTLAKRISVDNFGRFGVSQAYYSYFLIMLNMGLPLYAIKEFAKLQTESERIQLVNQIISTRFLIFIFLVFPYVLIAFYISQDYSTFLLILSMGITLIFMIFNLEWYYRAIQKMQYIAIANITKSFLFLGGIYIFISPKSNIISIGAIFAFSFFILVILYIVFSQLFKKIRIHLQIRKLIPILRESIVLGLSLFLIQIYFNFGILILGFSRSKAEAGYFTTIFKLLMFFLAIVTIYVKVIFPQLAVLAKEKTQLKRFIIRLTRLSSLLSLLVVIIIALLGRPIILLIFGDKYLPAVGPFQILIFTFFVITTRSLIENSLIVTNKSKKYLMAVFIGALWNLCMNLLFTPRYGIYATATITLSSEIVFLLMVLFYSEFNLREFIKN